VSPRLRAEIQETFFFVASEKGLDAAIDAAARAGADAHMEIHRTVPQLVRRIAAYLDVSVEQLRRGSRGGRKTSTERHLALWVLRQLGYSYPDAARAVGFREHTAAMHGVRRVQNSPELLDRAQRMLAVVGHVEIR